MMRVIPKRTNVRMELFRGIEAIDVLIGSVGTLIVISFAMSNLPMKAVWAVAMLTLTVLLIFPVGDEKGYMIVLCGLRYIGKPRHFAKKSRDAATAEDLKTGADDNKKTGRKKPVKLTVEDITPFTAVNGGFIEYGEKYSAVVMSISSVEFRFYTQMRQDNLIDRVFGGILRTAAEDEMINLVKLDRPVIYDDFIKSEQAKLEELKEGYINGIFSKDELTVRVGIIQDRIEHLQNIDFRDKVYMPFHYLMFIHRDRQMLTSQIEHAIADFAAVNIECKRLEGPELAIFLKYNYGMNFDERIAYEIDQSQYMDWILPDEIKIGTRTVQYDDLITHNFRISNYPVLVGNSWGAEMFNTVGTKIVMKMTPIERDKAVRQIDRSLEELRDQRNNTGKASRIIDLDTQIQALAAVLRSLQGENETLFNVNMYVQVNDYELSENKKKSYKIKKDPNSRKKRVRQALAEEGFRVTDMFMQQFEAYSSTSLSGFDAFESYKRGIHSTSCAAVFPFVYKSLCDEDGLYIGNSSGIPVFINFFRRDSERVNSNTVIIGKSGSGKSYATKSILAQLAAEDSKIFILDPENEYTKMAAGLNGKIIDVGTATQGRLNPFHIITSLSDDESDSEEAEETQKANTFSAHLQFLEEFYRQILPGVSPEALEFLNTLTTNMYTSRGIDHNTDFSTLSASDYPTFNDLYDDILETFQTGFTDNAYTKGILRSLMTSVSKFAEGGRDSALWNGEATITTEENFVVFDFQTLLANKNGTIANAQMLLVLKWLDNEIIKNREYNMLYNANRKIVIVIDEAHVFIDDKYPIALDFMFQLAKRIRKYNGMQIVITQNIKDFVGTEELARKSTAIINASQYSFIFSLSPNDMTDLIKLYENAGAINESEQDDIINNGRGRAFLITSPGERTNVDIVAGKGIEQLFKMA
ncbi:VirB4 family type IV secretion system protein [Lachnospiraceae bacterium C1.1]|nr:DUF87 domain-containing protein [Lachnospiraceae bacterium C1.1]